MKTQHSLLIALACVALLAAAGCKPKSPGLSDIQSTSGDRHIRVLVEGGAWVESGEAGFTVKLPKHEIVIGKEQVLVNKKEWAKVPADAKRFEVISKAGTLTVTSDGSEILKASMAK